jgi:protein-disulfide isomerase
MARTFRTVRTLLNLAVVLLCSAGTAAAQSMTQQQADAILNELRAIRLAIDGLAQRPSQPAAPTPRPVDDRVKLSNPGAYTLGRADAPLTIVEFTDLQCPFCSRFATQTFDELKRNYIDTGQVRFITRDLPLPNLHPHAHQAAVAARCAGEQGQFWELRTHLVRNASALSPAFIKASSRQLNLDPVKFDACLGSGKHDADIQKDVTDAGLVGITGTPSFVIGRTSGTAIEGVKVVGAQPYATFDVRLRQLLADKLR